MFQDCCYEVYSVLNGGEHDVCLEVENKPCCICWLAAMLPPTPYTQDREPTQKGSRHGSIRLHRVKRDSWQVVHCNHLGKTAFLPEFLPSIFRWFCFAPCVHNFGPGDLCVLSQQAQAHNFSHLMRFVFSEHSLKIAAVFSQRKGDFDDRL